MHQKDFIIHVYYSNKEFQTDCIFNESRESWAFPPEDRNWTRVVYVMSPPSIACSLKPKAPRNFSNVLLLLLLLPPLLADNMQTRRKPALNLQGIRSCDRSREQGWREKPSVVRVCRSWGGWLYLCSAISCYLCSAARRNSVSSRANCLSIVNADPETMLYSRRRTVGLVLLLDRGRTYPVFLANSARVFQIAGPSQAQSSLLEVTIREHVRQTKRVVVLLWKKFLALAKF